MQVLTINERLLTCDNSSRNDPPREGRRGASSSSRACIDEFGTRDCGWVVDESQGETCDMNHQKCEHQEYIRAHQLDQCANVGWSAIQRTRLKLARGRAEGSVVGVYDMITTAVSTRRRKQASITKLTIARRPTELVAPPPPPPISKHIRLQSPTLYFWRGRDRRVCRS